MLLLCAFMAKQAWLVLWLSKPAFFSSVQSLSHVQLFVTPWTAACQVSLSLTNSQTLIKLMSIETVMPPNHLILCRPLLFLLSMFLSIRVFSKESVLRISPFNEHAGLISSRSDWFDLPAVQGDFQESSPTLQFKSINSSAFSFFMVHFSHPYMTTGKIITLTRWNFVVKKRDGNTRPSDLPPEKSVCRSRSNI